MYLNFDSLRVENVHEWQLYMSTFSNLKTYLPSALKHLFGYHFKILWKKRNIIVTFQSDYLKEQPKTLDDLDCFKLKFLLESQ
jgi:hypothetical protein